IAAAGMSACLLGSIRGTAAGAPSQTSTKVGVLRPEAVEGPFYFDPKLVRTDIAEGKHGTPLMLTLQIVEANDCAPVSDVRVDFWHADALGLYSGYARQATVRQRGRPSCAGRNSPGPQERCVSPRSIQAGIQAERPHSLQGICKQPQRDYG